VREPLFFFPLLLLFLPLLASAGDGADLAAVKRLLEAEDPSARAAAVRRLAAFEGRAATGLLLDCLDDDHPYVRRAAAGVLGTVAEGSRPRLVRDLGRLHAPRARAEACRALALWADATGRDGLLARLEDRDADVRAAAVGWLASDEEAAVDEALRGRLSDPDGGVRALAVDVLVAREAEGVPSPALLADPDWRVRLSALEGSVVRASPSGGGGAATVAVLHGLGDAVWSVRLLAAELSREVPDARLLPALVPLLEDERQRVSEAAHASLVALTGIPFEPRREAWEAWLATDGLDFDPAAPRPEPGRAVPSGGHTVARPRFLGLEIPSRHVAFVLDASGSMARRGPDGETRWAGACRALDGALAGLDGAQVAVFLFQEEVRSPFDGSVRMGAARRRALADWLAGIRPGGRTALFDGIAAALADPGVDTVVVLSDGAPSAGLFFTKTDLLTEVRRLNRWHRARIDVIALGGDGIARRWRDALERLAEESGGTCLSR